MATSVEKKPYRVIVVGASYFDPTEAIGPDGSDIELQVYKIGRLGEEIELTEKQATRLLDLGAVAPADAPLTYNEMGDIELAELARERGLGVRGTGANEAVLKEDLINALTTYDKGQGAAPADDDVEDLSHLKRADLETRALAAGVEEPDKLPNKDAIIEAIQAAEAS